MERSKPGKFEEFYGLLQHVHKIPNVDVLVGYADIHGDLLPINNDDNYHKAVSTANPLLRIFIQKKGKYHCIKIVIQIEMVLFFSLSGDIDFAPNLLNRHFL